MKFPLLLMLLCLSVNLSYAAENKAISEIAYQVSEELYFELPSSLPVVLDIDAAEFTDFLEKLLKEKLIDDGYQVFLSQNREHYRFVLTYNKETKSSMTGFPFYKKQRTLTNHFFAGELIHYPSERIMSVKNYKATTVSRERVSEMRWYDPILISAIIGSLAYLFYFGD